MEIGERRNFLFYARALPLWAGNAVANRKSSFAWGFLGEFEWWDRGRSESDRLRYRSPAQRCWPPRSTSARTLTSWLSPSACLTPESPSSMSTSRVSTSSSMLSHIFSGEFWMSGRGEHILGTHSFINWFDKRLSREDKRTREHFSISLLPFSRFPQLLLVLMMWAPPGVRSRCCRSLSFLLNFLESPHSRDFGATLKCGVWDHANFPVSILSPRFSSLPFSVLLFRSALVLLAPGRRALTSLLTDPFDFSQTKFFLSTYGWRSLVPDILALLGHLDTRVALFSYLFLICYLSICLCFITVIVLPQVSGRGLQALVCGFSLQNHNVTVITANTTHFPCERQAMR